ncbi:MAG TPA: hypothetical protein VMW30_02700 [Candidatus Paceibacterota bacterium]|nr:hypothetical protein [Candidatus Paceibacterota bacterium]
MTTYSKLFRKPMALSAAFLAILPLLFSTPSNAATTRPKAPKASCRIEIGNAHLSTHLNESMGLKAVKVNAQSICNVPQRNVKLTVQIYKVGLFRDYLITEKFTNPFLATSSGMRVKNLQTFRRCASTKKSSFYGIAFAEALIAGQKSTAHPARSRKIVPLDCGT